MALTTLTDFALSSHEKREQRIIDLRNQFNLQKIVTVASAQRYFDHAGEGTILGYCKDGDIPLLINNHETVVPLTGSNTPEWLKGGDN